MRPSEWVKNILSARNITYPDGQPLYQYRITDEEFSDLFELLKLSSNMGINHIVKMLSWDACFVFYAAEWWRRFYSGHWGWEGIFESIGINYNELTISRRNDLIELGLQRWKRDLRVSDGTRKFLGTIATEGGLPLNQLVDQGGWLKSILKPVLKKHVSRGISISLLIENYRDFIPRSYRSNELENILADIVEIIVKLRKDYALTTRESPLDWLNQHHSDWRNLFPLPIDDASGMSLLSDLVDAASKTKEDEDAQNPFVIDRYLMRAESSSPDLVAQLDMPTFLKFKSLGIEKDGSDLPSSYEIEVYEINGDVWPWCRGFLTTYREEQVIKLSGRTLKLSGIDATKQLKLRFKSMGEIFHEIEIQSADLLDFDLPWLFRKIDDKWVLHGVASQSIKENTALVYVPSNQTIESISESTELLGKGELFNGRIYSLSGGVQLIADDARFKMSTGDEESLVKYQLSGKMFPFNSVPREIFIGTPDLVEENLMTGFISRKRGRSLIAKPVGEQTNWKTLSDNDTGFYEIRLLDNNNNILLRKKVGILSADFSYRLCPDSSNVSSGSIKITCATSPNISVSNERVKSRVIKNLSSTDVILEADGAPPHSFNLSLIEIGRKREVLLTFPFPSKGALLFDPSGNQGSFSNHLYLNSLKGYRIKVFDEKYHPGQKVDLTFYLIDRDLPLNDARDIYIRRHPVLKGEITEFAINDWMPLIGSLMSVSTSLDSSVKVSMVMHGHETFCFSIFRYENEMMPNWNEGVVEIDSEILQGIDLNLLEETRVSALFLNQPEQQDYILTPIVSGLAMTGKWLFAPEKRENGPWLIYPLEDSKLKFRPLLWNVKNITDAEKDDVSDVNSLQKAMSITDKHKRAESIRGVLKLMSRNLEHKSWLYMDHLWEKTRHLPMATFDVWKAAVSEPEFLASLLMRNNDDILNKLEQEFPLIWELVRLSEWESSLKLYIEKISVNLDGDDELLNNLIRKKIQKIESLSLSMLGVAKILRFRLLNEESQELKALKLSVESFLKPRLIEQTQNLLHRQSDSEWPKLLNSYIVKKCSDLPASYTGLLSEYHPFQKSIIYLPLLLAWRALTSDMEDWPENTADLFKIQQLKNFDEDWFNAIYQFLSGWLSQNIQLEKL